MAQTKHANHSGKLRIGDDWNAITIIALSQNNPLKAVAEFVENSIDAGAKNITITRGKERGEHYLRIVDDGRGVPRDDNGVPNFRYVATHVCDSIKRRLKAEGVRGIQGEFGIGKAIALGFAKAGAAVSCGARTVAEIESTANAIRKRQSAALSVPLDVTDPDRVRHFFDHTAAEFGGIDIAVLNAGVMGEESMLEDSDPASWRKIIETNLVGTCYCAKAAIPHLRARRGGKIILIGSGMGHRGIPRSSAYSCSKAGLWMLTQVLAEELRTDGIAVNELIPGPVDSMPPGALTESTAAAVEWLKKPADVVPLALFLATQGEMGPTDRASASCGV